MNKKRLFLVVMSVILCAFQSIYANDPKDLTNWTDGGKDYDNKYAYDANWFDSTASEYTISTPAEMAAFAKASVNNTFEGKIVRLAADLNMEKYGWVSIGEKGFKGTFDGMGHTITYMSYRDESSALAWGLFHTIDGGTVKNVIVAESTFTNDKTGAKSPGVGGIAAILKGNGTISNCGFSGAVQLPFDKGAENLGKMKGLIGGIVGILEEGTIDNCYAMNNAPIVPNDTIYGNIAGKSNGTISKCYYLANDTLPNAVNKDQIQGTQTNVLAKESDSFASGEIAYLLNINSKDTWGQNNAIPVLAGDNVPAIYKIDYLSEEEHGKVTGAAYAGKGTTVTLASSAAEGYVVTDLKVNNATLVNYSTFIMPDKDVAVSYVVRAIPATIMAFPAEDVKSKSFVAKWNKVDGATDYKVTVKKGNTVLDLYNAIAVGNVTSVEVKGLAQNSDYTYTVQSVTGDITSTESNNITVTTANVEVSIPSVERRALTVVWDAVNDADNYVVSLTDKSGGTTSIETKDCEYRYAGLDVASAYTVVVTANNKEGEPLTISAPVIATTTLDYGKQLTNSAFEAWEKQRLLAEPVGWNSFTSGGGPLMTMTNGDAHMEKSETIRPGSTGAASVRIWTKTIATVPANGNLTTGKINSGSMTATDPSNHNRTFVEDPEFNQPLNGARPDSLTVWVNYSSNGNAEMSARIAATIHDAYNYADPSATEDSLHAVAKAEINYKAIDATNGGWQRLSIPFDYELKGFDAFYERMNNSQYWKDSLNVEEFTRPTSADYMLVTFATNATPGVGKYGDQVYIDDMVLVYNPTLNLVKTDKVSYVSGSKISVDYTLEGTMSPSNLNSEPNVVSLELSDAKGGFDKPSVLAQIVTDNGGVLSATLEDNLALGNYKLRIVTTNYPMISNELSIEIVAPVAEALAATEVRDNSFIANWKAPADAEPTDYLLTVKEGDAVLEGYNDKATGKVTNCLVEGLTGGASYTYTVKAVYGETASEESNIISVETLATGIEDVTSDKVSVYPTLAVDVLYVIGVAEGSNYVIYDAAGSAVNTGKLSANKVNVAELNTGVYFIETQFGKARFIKK